MLPAEILETEVLPHSQGDDAYGDVRIVQSAEHLRSLYPIVNLCVREGIMPEPHRADVLTLQVEAHGALPSTGGGLSSQLRGRQKAQAGEKV